jgi:hypothetical protein
MVDIWCASHEVHQNINHDNGQPLAAAEQLKTGSQTHAVGRCTATHYIAHRQLPIPLQQHQPIPVHVTPYSTVQGEGKSDMHCAVAPASHTHTMPHPIQHSNLPPPHPHPPTHTAHLSVVDLGLLRVVQVLGAVNVAGHVMRRGSLALQDRRNTYASGSEGKPV